MVRFLFVYGTLRSEFDNPHARFLRAGAEFAGKATAKGSIFRIKHYPGFCLEPAGTVRGELYRLHTPAVTLDVLDRYEGAEYDRVLIQARPAVDGDAIEAWVYRYKELPQGAKHIESGDFCAE